MPRFISSRTLVGAALTVLLSTFAIAPAMAEPPAPVITVTWTSAITQGASYQYGAVPAGPTCTAADELLQPVDCAVFGYAVTVGKHTLVPMVGVAPGVASTPTIAYTVTPTWRLVGFSAPVKEAGIWNKAKAGSTIPLKFKIYEANGVKAKSKAVIAAFGALQVSCTDASVVMGGKTIDFRTVTKKGFALKYHHGAFHQNWKTPKAVKAVKVKGKPVAAAPTCYQVTMTAVDGQSLVALFNLK
jgi:hypothetical protein